MKYDTLIENIRYVKKVLKTPYHFFTLSNTNKDLIVLVLESKEGFSSRKKFTGDSVISTVKEACAYVENEIKNGYLKEVEEKEDKKNKKKEEDDSENNETEESKIKDENKKAKNKK